MIGAAFGYRVRFVTLADLFGKFRLLDLALNTFETIKVKRGVVPLAAVRQALDHLADGGVVAVFPEGTRGWRFGDLPLAAGAAWLAARAKVPLVPMAIAGTDRVLGVDNRLHRGHITVTVGPPMYAEGSGRSAVDELTSQWADWIDTQLRGHER